MWLDLVIVAAILIWGISSFAGLSRTCRFGAGREGWRYLCVRGCNLALLR